MAVTFGEVITYATSGEGDCCTDPARLETLMQGCLQSAWTALPEHERWQHLVISTVAGTAEYPISSGTSRVSSLALGPCELAYRAPTCDPCLTPDTAEGRGKPVHWWADNRLNRLYLSPTPDAVYQLILRYLGPVDTTLRNSNGSWKNVPLPDKYLPAFQLMVRGKAVMEADPARGAMLYNQGAEDLNTIVLDARAAPRRPWQLGPQVRRRRTASRPQTYTHVPNPPEP